MSKIATEKIVIAANFTIEFIRKSMVSFLAKLSMNPEMVPLKVEEFVDPVVVLTTMTKFVWAGTVKE